MLIFTSGVVMERSQLGMLADIVEKSHRDSDAYENPCPERGTAEVGPLDLESHTVGVSTYSNESDLVNQLAPVGVITVTVADAENLGCSSIIVIAEDFDATDLDVTTHEIDLQEHGVFPKLIAGFHSLYNRVVNPGFNIRANFTTQMQEDEIQYRYWYTINNKSLNTIGSSIEAIIVPSLLFLVLNLVLITLGVRIYISNPLKQVSDRINTIQSSSLLAESSIGNGPTAGEAKTIPSGPKHGIRHTPGFTAGVSSLINQVEHRDFREIDEIKEDLSQLERRLNPVDVISIKEGSTLHDISNSWSNIERIVDTSIKYAGNLEPKQYEEKRRNKAASTEGGDDTHSLEDAQELVRQQHLGIHSKVSQLIWYATSKTIFSNLDEFELRELLHNVKRRGLEAAWAREFDAAFFDRVKSFEPIDIVWAKEDETQIVYANTNDLEDIVYNFVENSVKAVYARMESEKSQEIKRTRGQIILSAGVTHDFGSQNRPETMSVIAIEDNGIGMSDYNRKNLFKFELGRNEAQEVDAKDERSGLGLYYCRQQIRRLGGTIELADTRRFDVNQPEGSGTTFKIYLPTKNGSPHCPQNQEQINRQS